VGGRVEVGREDLPSAGPLIHARRTRQVRYSDDANLDEANYRRRCASVCSLSTCRRRRCRRRRCRRRSARGHATSIRAFLFRRIVAPARLSRPQSPSVARYIGPNLHDTHVDAKRNERRR